MYRKLSQSTDNVLGYTFSDTITKAEVEEIQREMTRAIETHGSIRLLVQVADLSMPELGAVWQDLKMVPDYVTKVERMALVGESSWREWAAKAADLTTQGEARHFDADKLDEAWEWVRA